MSPAHPSCLILDVYKRQVYEQIAEVFGQGILQTDGMINRRALGAIVFNQPEELLSLIHI